MKGKIISMGLGLLLMIIIGLGTELIVWGTVFFNEALLFMAIIGVEMKVASRWPMINDVQTGATPEYPDILPQYFNLPHEKVFQLTLMTVEAFGWEVITKNKKQAHIHAVATTKFLYFQDDVIITIGHENEEVAPSAEGNASDTVAPPQDTLPLAGAAPLEGVRVDIRSRSRVGKGDFGANARRIRLFQAELAKQIQSGIK